MGGNSPKYIVLEIHYDNPELTSGLVDDSGLELFYVDEEPEFRAGLLSIGQFAASSLIIPPEADNFEINGLCPSECTKKVSIIILNHEHIIIVTLRNFYVYAYIFF